MSTMDKLEEQKNNFPRIPESLFKKYVGALVSETASPNERKKWLDVCIDPRLYVIVVDDVTGKEIHRVPPLIYTSNTLTGRNVAGTVKTIAQMNDSNYLLGRQYARDHITEDLVVGKPPADDVALWRYILSRYGITQESVSAPNDGDVLGLEDADDGW